MSHASEVPGPRFAPASVDASHQIALEIRRYLEREGLQPGDRIGTEQELATEFGVIPPDAPRGPTAAGQLAPDPRRPRPRRRDLRRPHAQRGHEPQRHRVDLDDAGDRVGLTGRAARRPDVPRGAARRPGRSQRHRGDRRRPPGRDRRGRRATSPARRRSTTPTSASTRSSPTRPATSCCWPSPADPRGPAAAADRRHLARVDGAEILRQHRDIQRAVRRKQSAAAESAMRAHIAYLKEIQGGD